jgi:hypothetical protein
MAVAEDGHEVPAKKKQTAAALGSAAAVNSRLSMNP